MADGGIMGRIDSLIAEEKELRARALGVGLSGGDQERLTGLEAELDQCWDLLRQRRARAEFNEDPEGAEVRSVREVEGYRQ